MYFDACQTNRPQLLKRPSADTYTRYSSSATTNVGVSTRRIQNHSGAPAGHGGAPKVHAEECAALGGVEGRQLGGNSGDSKGGGSDGEEGGGEGEGEGSRGGRGSGGGADGSDPIFAISFCY